MSKSSVRDDLRDAKRGKKDRLMKKYKRGVTKAKNISKFGGVNKVSLG